MGKWIDMPPVWLLGAVALAWGLGQAVPEPSFGGWARAVAPVLVLAGLALIAAAAWEFRRARTTIIPHEAPQAMVAQGVYRLSRNPIYLGDALILAGAILWGQAVVPLVLLPLFVWIIRARFILPEEARLAAAFPDAFAAYRARTRRWI
ncbi:methyltransferase [Psychromarinibacter sp. C21-152]|uniref:Methyltransferase n=1 Tax=Psychromarinibacter sediminicola TaxID=3033385 RepID=A0AAE3NVR8_9RHOB|nr:methyltransferase [Psychromarinibacter sediminicola]MDF0602926.1 methyltransferase [Psychromarinibacter sediminicola]